MRRVVTAAVIAASCVIAPSRNADAGGTAGNVTPSNVNVNLDVQEFVLGGRPGDWEAPCTKDKTPPGGDPKVDYSTQGPTEHFEVDSLAGYAGQFSVVRLGNKDLWSAKWVTFEGLRFQAGLSYVLCKWTYPDLDKDLKRDPPPDDAPWYGFAEYVGAHWYPIRPEPRILIPPLFAKVQKTIGKPVLSWPNMNKENGWLFVAVPMAYTLDPIGYVEARASVSNELDSASAWIRATPTRIDVEADGDSSSCLVGDAMTDHGTDEDPPCALIFEHVGRNVPVTVTLTWTITSSLAGADLPATVTTTTDDTVDVAEIQALVES